MSSRSGGTQPDVLAEHEWRVCAAVGLVANASSRCETPPKSSERVAMAHRKPRARSGVLRVAVVAALMGLVVSPLGAAGKEHARQLETPNASDLRFGYGAEDRDDEGDFGRGSEPRPTTRAFRIASGEEVRIGVSPAYSFDAGRLQAWADFIGSLLHG